MKLTVNENCIGCGLCEQLCPQVFRLNQNAQAQVVGNADLCTESAQNAAASCPVNAIEIE